ncbi:unnamed protein product [Urochloa humidicola]
MLVQDALVGAKTFKPRFDALLRLEEWRVNSARRAKRPSVWARLGSKQMGIHERPGGQVVNHNGFLELLRTKAVGRCFNCLARDHRIVECRDPPRCVLCSRSGHKARFCPSRRGPNTAPTSSSPFSALGIGKAPSASAFYVASKQAGGASSAARVPCPSSMDFIPGDAERRPDRVVACAARSAAVREAEQDLLLHGLIAVQLDSRAQLTCEAVLRDVLHQLNIPESALRVSRISTAKFLLRFDRLEFRNMALARRGLSASHTTLHLMAWNRQACASTSSKLPYRARICLEGVPDHAHQVETVLHLLPKQSFAERIDLTRVKEDEWGCFIL